jgi:hypothetical protein
LRARRVPPTGNMVPVRPRITGRMIKWRRVPRVRIHDPAGTTSSELPSARQSKPPQCNPRLLRRCFRTRLSIHSRPDRVSVPIFCGTFAGRSLFLRQLLTIIPDGLNAGSATYCRRKRRTYFTSSSERRCSDRSSGWIYVRRAITGDPLDQDAIKADEVVQNGQAKRQSVSPAPPHRRTASSLVA